MENQHLVQLTADIVAAHAASNSVEVDEIAGLVVRVHQALSGLGRVEKEAPQAKVPVVSVKASVKPDRLICLACGKPSKVLKGHLKSAHGFSPAQYRQEYGLASSYPMTAPDYSEKRRDLAKQIGLGSKGGRRKAQQAQARGKGASGAKDAATDVKQGGGAAAETARSPIEAPRTARKKLRLFG